MEDTLHQSSPHQYPTVAYVVFHHGRTCIFYDTLPANILDLRTHILFWIDHSTNEIWSRGKPLAKGERLQPRAEEMLRFLCGFERAGRTIALSDLFTAVWTPTTSQRPEAARNNLGVQQNAINTFAAEKFILTASPDSQHDKKKIFRLRGKAAYTIGNRAYEELCIIKAIHGQKPRGRGTVWDSDCHRHPYCCL